MPPRLNIDREAFREAWLAGESTKTIEARFGVSKNYVQRLRRKLDLPPRLGGYKKGHEVALSKVTIERREKIAKLHAQGKTNRQMLDELGLTAKSGFTTISTDLKALGLRKNGGPEESARAFSERLNGGSALAQECTTACADCGGTWHGTLAETREQFRSHVCPAAVAA
jgi:hypothetical protein